MNARSTSVWIAALALGLGSDVAAATQASAPSNVASLGLARSTALADEGQQEAAELSWKGTSIESDAGLQR
jgi:hypothetical protein